MFIWRGIRNRFQGKWLAAKAEMEDSMIDWFLHRRIASFRYDGWFQELVPACMERVGENAFAIELGHGLCVRLDVELAKQDAMAWVVRFTNTGGTDTGRISAVLGLDLELSTDSSDSVVWRSLKGDSCDGESFMPLQKSIPVGAAHHVEPTHGRSSQETGFPYFDLACGKMGLVCGLGWTGQWQLDIARDNHRISLQAGQQDSDFHLKPKETARSIGVFLLTGSDDMECLRCDFRRMHRLHFSPSCRLGPRLPMPVAVQVFDRYFYKDPEFATEATQRKLLDSVASCGTFDTFWLDAAWFRSGFPNGVGNYAFAEGFPRGLDPIAKRVHEYGMKFMVWFEPERVCNGSDVYREHRQDASWLLSVEDNPSDTRLLNLGNPEVRTWLLDTLSTFILENGIDIYRQDFNMDPLAYWRAADEEGRRGWTEMKHVEGLYWLWDSLVERFPDLLIDNCAGGGRRIDFETCRRSVPLWRSDTACYPENGLCTWNRNLPMKVSTWHQNQTMNLSRYLPYHASSSWSETAYDFRSGATMGIACTFGFLDDGYDAATATAATQEILRIRDSWDGDFYALTEPTCAEDVWAAYQLHDGETGFCMVFRRKSSENATKRIRLRGLDPKQTYSVALSDERRVPMRRTISGEEMGTGIDLELPVAMTSLLIEYHIQRESKETGTGIGGEGIA